MVAVQQPAAQPAAGGPGPAARLGNAAKGFLRQLYELGYAAGFKSLQALVGTGFWVILNTLGTIAYWQRKFYTPPALAIAAAARKRAALEVAGRPSAMAAGSEQQDGKPRQRPTVMIRATATESGGPMHITNNPSLGHDSEAWRLVGPYMRLYGRNAVANSQLFNPEFIHFYIPGVGSLPYVVADIYYRVVVIAIGDPLTHKSAWRSITEKFKAQFPTAFFYHASEEYARLLHDMGYYINDVGAETTLQVQSWTYNGRTRTVRSAARSARESGVRVRELSAEDLTDEMRHKLEHEISGEWLQQKAVAERQLRVLVRHIDYANMQLREGVRIFVAERWHPAHAPPAVVDEALQGLPPNVKPPKPPRNKSGRLGSQSSLGGPGSQASLSGLASQPSVSGLSRSSSVLSRGDSIALWTAGSVELATAPSLSAIVNEATEGTGGAASGFFDPTKPQLLGFVLLDPLWEGGEQVGFVSSIVRMKRSAHQGTLKLLYEDIISKLRSEGRRELAFGFAPFFNVRDAVFPRIAYWIRWTNLYFYHYCNNLYAFQNLAFSKIRYGAGVTPDGTAFRDPNVSMTHIYMASQSQVPGMCILDLYVVCMYVGFMAEMFDTLLKLVGVRRGGANLDNDMARNMSAV